MTIRDCVRQLREQGLDLFLLAEEIESGRRKAPTTHMRLACPDCGAEYSGREFDSGAPCLTKGCEGIVARKVDLVRTKDGRTYPVTVDHMAGQNALADFLADGRIDGNEWPHLARKSGGR
jgi:hypothetical protein